MVEKWISTCPFLEGLQPRLGVHSNVLYVKYSCFKCKSVIKRNLDKIHAASFTSMSKVEKIPRRELKKKFRAMLFISVDKSNTIILGENRSVFGPKINVLSPNFPCNIPNGVYDVSCDIRPQM